MILTPKNWTSFQHYKDRAPPWIKLHRGLLDNLDYYRLSPEAAKALPLIWLIASERDGLVPAGAELAFRLRVEEELANDIVIELMAGHFLVESNAKTAEHTATLAQRQAKSNGFGSRHISDGVKRAVWLRDGGKCCQCDSEENVEYDHKHPVSKGGNSEEDNIQLLCRPCNRAKRTKLATPAQPLRSLEKRREEIEEEDIEKRKRETRASALVVGCPSDFREQFWSRYPNKVGKPKALAKLEACIRRGVAFSDIIDGLDRYIATKPPDRAWLNPETFINQERWADQPAMIINGRRTVHDAAKDLHENLVARVLAFDEPAPSSLCERTGPDVIRLLPARGRE